MSSLFCEIFVIELKTLFLLENRTQTRFFNLFQQTTRPILIIFSGKIEEFFVSKKTSQGRLISSKVGEL